ncbi:hypothetical protein [Clostridium pasteurianum]|uniref:Uncharacterized protein n=1 Tax=Clostridium pasteurianum BC1 TaxID=86416 RepID=R4KA65_CLOPA|nr:hypothetical protein [Clostridium pasteurianum]AGK96505.1 hypothetical protein Clopa_1572 [Clostridium pasteurianum BC1]
MDINDERLYKSIPVESYKIATICDILIKKNICTIEEFNAVADKIIENTEHTDGTLEMDINHIKEKTHLG